MTGGAIEGIESAARAPAHRVDTVCGQVGALGIFDDFSVEVDLGLNDPAEHPREVN